MNIGWASCDITPEKLPVYIAGQTAARLSEGVDDPLTATVLALDSGEDQVIFVGCDLIGISRELREAIDLCLVRKAGGPDPRKIIFHATHTHTGPEIRLRTSRGDLTSPEGYGLRLPVASPLEYLHFLAERLAATIQAAWHARKPGRIAYGMDDAVVGRNRRWVDQNGVATMYGLKAREKRETFRHMEGYEDHSVNLLATYDEAGTLTGVVVNVPCPAQETEQGYQLSADFWHDTRRELHSKWGAALFVLPQCSVAGDLTSHRLFEYEAHERMLKLRGHSARRAIAIRIADAVDRILPAISESAEASVPIIHDHATIDLPANQVSAQEAQSAREAVKRWESIYQKELERLKGEPAESQKPRWYHETTNAFRMMNWHQAVIDSYEKPQERFVKTEVHVVRVGEIAFASNPFEYYLDFGIQIKVRSPCIQTFLIQLAGRGTYVPSPRSVKGGGYGSNAASNPIGSEGGQLLAEHTVATLQKLFT